MGKGGKDPGGKEGGKEGEGKRRLVPPAGNCILARNVNDVIVLSRNVDLVNFTYFPRHWPWGTT